MKLSPILAAGALAVVVSGPAGAAGFDFESTPVGTYASLTDGYATITYTGPYPMFDVVDASPGAPIDGRAIISYFTNPDSMAPFRVTFAGGASAFTVGVGDYNEDEDNSYLAAWGAGDVLLDVAYFHNDPGTFGGGFLSVASGTPIAYVTFWDMEPYPGAVYWDNIRYTPVVPEPGTYALMGLGLAALGFIARRRRQG